MLTLHEFSIKGFCRRFFVSLPFICKLPAGYFLKATLQRTEQTPFVQVDSEYPSLQVNNACPERSSIAVTWLASLTTPRPTAPMRCKSIPQAMLDHGRPPDSRLSSGRSRSASRRAGEWDNSHLSFGKFAPSCFFLPFSPHSSLVSESRCHPASI